MKAIGLLGIASLIATLCAPSCTAASLEPNPTWDEPAPIGELPYDPYIDPLLGGDYCWLTGIACISGIVGTVPACQASCPAGAVIGCIGCAGAAGGTISACLNYSENCISTNAREGDLCRTSMRCETGGLHCVDNRCTASLGAEGQRCSTDRDCQAGVRCLPDGSASREAGAGGRGPAASCAAPAPSASPASSATPTTIPAVPPDAERSSAAPSTLRTVPVSSIRRIPPHRATASTAFSAPTGPARR